MTHSTWDNWLYSNWCLVEPPEYLSTWHILVCLSWWTVGGLWWICAVSQAWLGWYHETHPYFSFTSKQLQRQDDLYNRKLKVTSLDILSPTGPKERLRSKEASWSLRELPFRNVITHIFFIMIPPSVTLPLHYRWRPSFTQILIALLHCQTVKLMI